MQNLKSWLLNGRILLVLVLLALFAGCSDDDKGSTGEPGTLDRLWSHSTIQGCGSCHGPSGEVSNGPHLVTKTDFYNNLVNKNTVPKNWLPFIKESTCGEQNKLVQPGNPNSSAVLMAISKIYANGQSCTTAINIHQTLSVSETVVNDFRDWIENGAPAN